MEEDAREECSRFGRVTLVTLGKEAVAGAFEQPRVVVAYRPRRIGDEKLQRRALGCVLRGQRERLVTELDRGKVRVEPVRALRGLCEGAARRLAQRAPVDPGRLGECERLAVVVGQHLGMVIGAIAGEGRQPLCRPAVLVRPLRTRDLAVGDVPDERVEEGVLRLAGDRRAAVSADELLPLEAVQDALLRSGQRARPEDLADHRGVLQERFVLRREPVDPRRDQALHGFWER